MALFKFPKITVRDASSDTTEKKTPSFRGDLLEGTISPSKIQNLPYDTPGGDSPDSVVFMTFPGRKQGWTCRECGTRNPDAVSVCQVCCCRK